MHCIPGIHVDPEELLRPPPKGFPPRPQRLALRQGPHQSRVKGRGMEYAESRAYHPGDDVRHIDWRITARSGRVHTKLFQEERERPVLLVLNLTPSLYFGTRNTLKSVQACRVGALLGWQAFQRGDCVGAFVQGAQGHFEHKPSRVRPAFLRLLRKLAEFHNEPLQTETASAPRELEFPELLRQVLRVAAPGTLVHLLSDFESLSKTPLEPLLRLTKHGEVRICELTDPMEEALPGSGRMTVQSLTNDTLRFLLPPVRVRQNLLEQRQAERERLQDEYRRHGILWQRISTPENPLNALI